MGHTPFTSLFMNDTDSGGTPWAGYCAASWALSFAVLHIVWAAGWHIGLQAEQARKAFEQHWFLAYDLVVAILCLIAVPVALALVQPWGHRLPRWALGLLAWGGTAFLALRSGTSIMQIVYKIAKGTFAAQPLHLWELWFCIGAVLFGLSTWNWTHQHSTYPVRSTS
jgi:hypothetical protein